MELVGVDLYGDFESGAKARGLNLVFTSAGVKVQHPESHAESLVAWSGLDAARCFERLVLRDGRSAAVLELISDGRSLRFLLPDDSVAPGQAAYLDRALPAWLARYKSAPVVVPASAATDEYFAGSGAEEVPVPAPPGPGDGAGNSTTLRERLRAAVKDRRTLAILAVLVLVVVIPVVVYVVKSEVDTRGSSTGAAVVSAASALAGSVNVRASDLPAGWVTATVAASTPPPVAPGTQLRAVLALASCVQQPSAVVGGWLGTSKLPGQITAVTSTTLQSASDPTLQIVSTTKVMQSPVEARSLLAPFNAPNFATCFDQYQVAAVAVPITAQVQPTTMAFPAPAGVAAYSCVTTFTLSNHRDEVVQDAFIVGGRSTTVLQSSAMGLSVPSVDFTSAYHGVVTRVARADGTDG